jgi:hypothetical protein
MEFVRLNNCKSNLQMSGKKLGQVAADLTKLINKDLLDYILVFLVFIQTEVPYIRPKLTKKKIKINRGVKCITK